MKLSAKALREIALYNLAGNKHYESACRQYRAWYNSRSPNRDVPTTHMLKALRLAPLWNSADDWARLHVTEMFLGVR